MDACHKRLVLDTKTAFHQNEARTAKVIKKVGAHCTAVTWEAEAMHAATIWEAEAKCAVAIREAENACADHTHKLQKSHGKSMQNIEREAIEEEGWDHQSFLNACGVALQACPPEACGVLMFPLQLLARNMSLAALLVTTLPAGHHHGGPIPTIPHPTGLAVPTPPVGTKLQCCSSDWEEAS